MALFCCPECGYIPEDLDEPWCSRCGHNFVMDSGSGPLPAISRGRPRRHEIVVDGIQVHCPCCGLHLQFDPVSETMLSRFRCSRFPDRIDCVGCPICPICGLPECACRGIGIRIDVKLPTVIETKAY